MPGPTDHHRLIENPFEESVPRISEYTAQDIATLQSRLDRQLGPEYISTRPGPGGSKIHYLAADKVINLANEVFGFNGWSSSIRKMDMDFIDDDHGKISLGCSIICRVTLRDGTFHEDIGYGEIRNAPSKSAAFQKAKKEAATDALKRALRNFGNVLGNCLYDKSYLAKITKVKVEPSRWNVEDLHRHPSYGFPKKDPDTTLASEAMPAKDPSPPRTHTPNTGNEYDEEFGQIEDDDLMSPDEVCLRRETNNGSRNGHLSELNSNGHVAVVNQGPGQLEGKYLPKQQSAPSLRPQQAATESLEQDQGQRLQNASSRPTAPHAAYAPNRPTRPMSNGNGVPPDTNQRARGYPDTVSIPHSNMPRVQPPRGLPQTEPAQRSHPEPQPTRAQALAEQPQRSAQNQSHPQPQPPRPLPPTEAPQRSHAQPQPTHPQALGKHPQRPPHNQQPPHPIRPLAPTEALQRSHPQPHPTWAQVTAQQPQRSAQNQAQQQPPRPLPPPEALQRSHPQPQPTWATTSAEQQQRSAHPQAQQQPPRPMPSAEIWHRTPQNQPHSVEHANGKGAPLHHEPAVGFYNARAAEILGQVDPSNNQLPAAVPAFNPHADGGIRRTSGVNHSRSGPVSRQAIAGVTGQNGGHYRPGTNQTPSRPNFVNPQSDANRKIGMPGGMQSPLANRGAYKPPGPSLGKRDPEPLSRPPLANVSNIQAASQAQGHGFKRPRMEETNPHTGPDA